MQKRNDMKKLSKIQLGGDFSKKEPFVSLLFSEGEESKNAFKRTKLGNSLYSFGADVSEIADEIKNFWEKDADKQTELLLDYYNENGDTEGLNFYDIPVIEVSDGQFVSVEFTEDQPLETFRRASFDDRATVLSDLKRQLAKIVRDDKYKVNKA